MKNQLSVKNNNHKNKPAVIGLEALIKASWLDISSFWRALLAISGVYALIYYIFVTGVPLFPTSESITANIEAVFGGTTGRFVDSLAVIGLSVTGVSAPTNSLLQIFLFLIASAAIVWAMRKQRGLKKISVTRAFYEGPSNIVPMILATVLLLLTMIPAAIASIGLNYALPIIGTSLERFVVYGIATPLIALSVYWLIKWWPVVYIIMLPETRPVASMRAAASLTKKRRFKIFLRLCVIGLVVLCLFAAVVIPMALISQRIAPITVYIMTFVSFMVAHVMLFNLYRSLVDEPKPAAKSKTA